MPRFFFHVQDGSEFQDLEGSELIDLAAAKSQAVQMAAQLLRDHHVEFWKTGRWQIEVTDEAEQSLFKLQFEARFPTQN